MLGGASVPCVELEGRRATPDHACVVRRVTLNRPHLRPCHGSQCVKTAAVKVIGVATGQLCVDAPIYFSGWLVLETRFLGQHQKIQGSPATVALSARVGVFQPEVGTPHRDPHAAGAEPHT